MYIPNNYLLHYKCDFLLHLKIETIYLISLLLFTFQLLLNLSQNLDYAFLMMYAQWRGVYYVQLEDDILTKVNYISSKNECNLYCVTYEHLQHGCNLAFFQFENLSFLTLLMVKFGLFNFSGHGNPVLQRMKICPPTHTLPAK